MDRGDQTIFDQAAKAVLRPDIALFDCARASLEMCQKCEELDEIDGRLKNFEFFQTRVSKKNELYRKAVEELDAINDENTRERCLEVLAVLELQVGILADVLLDFVGATFGVEEESAGEGESSRVEQGSLESASFSSNE